MSFQKGIIMLSELQPGAMVISLLVYIIFNKYLPNKETKEAEVAAEKVNLFQKRLLLLLLQWD